MSASPADPTSRVVLLLIQLSAAVHEAFGVTPVKVAFKTLEEGRSFSLPVPPLPSPLMASLKDFDSEELPAVTSTERRILIAVDSLKGASPTGEEVADTAKLPYESHLRKMLVTMRAKGLLGGAKNQPGYPITTLGLEILSPEH